MPLSRTSRTHELPRTVSPATARRAVSRRSPSPISSSSSSSPGRAVPSSSNAGIGRKVAASLDLFKETASSPSQEKTEPDAFDLPRPESSTSKRRGTVADGVGEAQFEFVKRSDWPDRGTAAIRREKSTTGLERVRTRESTSSVTSSREPDFRKRKERTLSRRDTVLHDLVEWRAAVAAGREEDGRGRPRERSVWIGDPSAPEPDALSPGSEPSSISSASTFQELRPPLSPSQPRRSTTSHQAASSRTDLHSAPIPIERAVSPLDLHQLPPPARRGPTRSRSPRQALADAPLTIARLPQYPHLESPWSTDDDDEESAWESASVTTTTSTTSASSPFPLSPSRTSLHVQPRVRDASDEDEERQQRAMLSSYDDIELNDTVVDDGSGADLNNLGLYGLSQESLPHIPLRPFRNQVGGHSAIYKFTKRAVCKVRQRVSTCCLIIR